MLENQTVNVVVRKPELDQISNAVKSAKPNEEEEV